MELFSGVEAFAAVVEAGSFRAGAARLGVTPAAVSKAVARLEEELGVRLLHRTTRSLSLSAEGERFLPACQQAISALRTVRAQVAASSRLPRGPLSVSMTPILTEPIAARLVPFCERYPEIQLHLRFTDRFVDLVGEKVDVAIRIGALTDSSLIARRLLQTRWVTVASPAYLARWGRPQHPDDLTRHRAVTFAGRRGAVTPWTFLKPGTQAPRAYPPPPGIDMDSGIAVVEAAVAGLGLCQAMDFMVQAHLRRGELFEVLAPFAAPGPPIHALCLPGQQRAPRVRAFLDHLSEVFAKRAES